MTELDYYALLGVERNATAAEIDRAFQLALVLADQGGQTGLAGDLVEAYEVLSDPQWRGAYDETGIGIDADRSPDTGSAEPLSRRGFVPATTVLPARARGRVPRLPAVLAAAGGAAVGVAAVVRVLGG